MTRPPAQRESDILREVLLALSARGWLVWRNNVGQARDQATGQHVRFGGPPGAADILGVGPDGRALAVEVKSRAGRQSPEQQRFEAAVRAHGGIYVLARSAADVVHQVLEAHQALEQAHQVEAAHAAAAQR